MGIMDLFKKKSSGNVAKDRLKLVLVSDRANCSSEMMEMMKRSLPQTNVHAVVPEGSTDPTFVGESAKRMCSTLLQL